MKKIFTSFFFLGLLVMFHAQWTSVTFKGKTIRERSQAKSFYSLDISLLRFQLERAQETGHRIATNTYS
ncbi:hypothetical protein BBH99_02200 [Chryseobacterium contaminans]|uniref:GLPGLI family protein n=1 Tax=Chryseobacterium contaminans TaxID=1423959 RepID=A0ABX2X344_9FLAO|nr:hypothetical protein [Chryseobacterium contaminans]OCA77762.1 hypothetical protein BBH99_02200 [Chryseobacterium contaminans]